MTVLLGDVTDGDRVADSVSVADCVAMWVTVMAGVALVVELAVAV